MNDWEAFWDWLSHVCGDALIVRGQSQYQTVNNWLIECRKLWEVNEK